MCQIYQQAHHARPTTVAAALSMYDIHVEVSIGPRICAYYMYIYIYMYMCMYIYIYIYMYKYTCMYMYTFMCIYTQICSYVLICINMVYKHIQIQYINNHTYIHTYIYIYIGMYVQLYICMHDPTALRGMDARSCGLDIFNMEACASCGLMFTLLQWDKAIVQLDNYLHVEIWTFECTNSRLYLLDQLREDFFPHIFQWRCHRLTRHGFQFQNGSPTRCEPNLVIKHG